MSLRIALAKPDWGIEGGFERLVQQLTNRLEGLGHSVRWLLPRIDEFGDRAFGLDVSELQSAMPDYVRFVQTVDRFSQLDLRRADLVISAMPGAYAVNHRRHISVFSHHIRRFYDLSDVLIEAGMVDDLAAHERAAELVRRIDARYLGATPLIFATSPEVARRLDEFNRLRHNVDVFEVGPSFDDSPPAPLRSDTFDHVLCVSRHEFPKRTELFVAAAAHLRGAPATAVGGGGRLGWAKHLAASFQHGSLDPDTPSRKLWCVDAPWLDPDAQLETNSIRFTGHVNARELDQLYRSAICVVAPAYLEDYGLTAIEAMAYGKPLIVCNDGGNLVNFVEHGVNGFIVEPDGRSIAEAAQLLVDDRALAQKLGAAARDTAQRYTWHDAMRTFQSGIERVFAA